MYILNHYTMKTFIQCIIFAILTFTSPFLDAQEKIIACPNELQQEWANAEIGVIIHFDMPVFHPDYNWRQFGTHPSPSTFNPSSLDTDQWIHTAKKPWSQICSVSSQTLQRFFIMANNGS